MMLTKLILVSLGFTAVHSLNSQKAKHSLSSTLEVKASGDQAPSGDQESQVETTPWLSFDNSESSDQGAAQAQAQEEDQKKIEAEVALATENDAKAAEEPSKMMNTPPPEPGEKILIPGMGNVDSEWFKDQVRTGNIIGTVQGWPGWSKPSWERKEGDRTGINSIVPVDDIKKALFGG